MIKEPVYNRLTRDVQLVADIDADNETPLPIRLGLAVKWAIKNNADLSDADLSDADLSGADMRSANMSGAKLRGANMSYANMSDADLSDADLSDADLSGAKLRGADMRSANMSGADVRDADMSYANMSDADLRGADMSYANMSYANMSYANMSGANMSGADLSDAKLRGAKLLGADLRGAKGAELSVARTVILPEGDLIVWKKCRGNVIVKLLVPADSKRSSASGRKCRAEYVKVLEVIGADVAYSTSDAKDVLEYRVGELVRCKEPFCEDRWQECASGIHFYITRTEAENH